MEKMEEWKSLLNKKVKAIYDDGDNYPKKKEGVLIEVNQTHIVIKINNLSQALLRSKILRIEEVGGND